MAIVGENSVGLDREPVSELQFFTFTGGHLRDVKKSLVAFSESTPQLEEDLKKELETVSSSIVLDENGGLVTNNGEVKLSKNLIEKILLAEGEEGLEASRLCISAMQQEARNKDSDFGNALYLIPRAIEKNNSQILNERLSMLLDQDNLDRFLNTYSFLVWAQSTVNPRYKAIREKQGILEPDSLEEKWLETFSQMTSYRDKASEKVLGILSMFKGEHPKISNDLPVSKIAEQIDQDKISKIIALYSHLNDKMESVYHRYFPTVEIDTEGT